MADLTKKDKDQKPAKKANPNKKQRRSPARVVKDTVSEMKKVTWPSRKDWLNHTAIVAIFVLIMMAIVFGIDSGLGALFGLLVS